MINKKALFKIFIIFFIAILTISICNTSKATVTVSNTSITVYVGKTTTVLIQSDSSTGGASWSQYTDIRTWENGEVEIKISSIGNRSLAKIKGLKKGKISRTFRDRKRI